MHLFTLNQMMTKAFYDKKVAQTSHTKVIILHMEDTLLESNARSMGILLLFSHQLKESVFGTLLILIMYWNRGIEFSKRFVKIQKGMSIQQFMNFLLISHQRVLMFLQRDLYMKVFFLRKRITSLKLTGIIVRAIEEMMFLFD